VSVSDIDVCAGTQSGPVPDSTTVGVVVAAVVPLVAVVAGVPVVVAVPVVVVAVWPCAPSADPHSPPATAAAC